MTRGRPFTSIRVALLVLIVVLTTISACSQGGPVPDANAPLDGRGGGFIAFHSFRDGNAEIYVMNADGSGVRRLTSTAGEDSCPDFAPDAARIAFTSERDGNSEVYVIKRDGTDPRRLTQTAADEMHPVWTPDGQRVVFIRSGDVWIMNADGSQPAQLTQGRRAELPWVTRDGLSVIFSDMSAGNYDLFLMKIDGSDLRAIAATAETEVFGRPSPSGNRLALMRGGRSIYLMGLDGSDRQLVRSDAENPCWAPDGLSLAFHSTQSGNYEIYRMGTDGKAVVNLTRNSGNDFWPSWVATR